MVENNIYEDFKISAVGDICPGDKSIMGLGVLSKTIKYGVDFPFDGVKNLLGGFDLLLGNFEGVLSNTVINKPSRQLTFCGQPDFGSALSKAGFQVVNIANNHTLEHGSEIFQETIRHLTNSGIRICGLRSQSSEFYSEPVIITKKGKTVGILGYNWIGTNKFSGADNYIAQVHDSIVNYSWHRDAAKDSQLRNIKSKMNSNVIHDIKQLRQKVDLVILMPHWGYEYVNYPPFGVILEAHTFIDAGADLIIGGHPHVIQGMEQYKSGLIFYSLGNFIFDSRDKHIRYSVLLDITWRSKVDCNYYFHPLYINKQFQPQIADIREKKHIVKTIGMSNQIISSFSSDRSAQDLEDDAVYRQYEAFYNKRKFKTILDHLIAIKEDTRVIMIILKKFYHFFIIIIQRLKGKKVRW